MSTNSLLLLLLEVKANCPALEVGLNLVPND